MSSQNGFLTKYSKSNNNDLPSQNINESFEWLKEHYDTYCISMILLLGGKYLLEKNLNLPIHIRSLVAAEFSDFYFYSFESLKHVDIVANGKIDEEMINVLEKYNAFSAIFDTEIQELRNICIDNKLVGLNAAVDSNNDYDGFQMIQILAKFTSNNERKMTFPETEELVDLFLDYVISLGEFGLINYKHIFFYDGTIFSFFPKFISLFKEGVFDECSDFTDLVEELFIEMIETINDSLDLDINVPDFTELSPEEMEECMGLYGQALKKEIEEGEILLLDFYEIESFYQEHKLHFVKLAMDPETNSKGAKAVLNYLNANSSSLITVLKEKGVQLSAVALQNDQNIARIANIVYNMLPGMVRIFVSYDTVENFLLNNRKWLINKLV